MSSFCSAWFSTVMQKRITVIITRGISSPASTSMMVFLSALIFLVTSVLSSSAVISVCGKGGGSRAEARERR